MSITVWIIFEHCQGYEGMYAAYTDKAQCDEALLKLRESKDYRYYVQDVKTEPHQGEKK